MCVSERVHVCVHVCACNSKNVQAQYGFVCVCLCHGVCAYVSARVFAWVCAWDRQTPAELPCWIHLCTWPTKQLRSAPVIRICRSSGNLSSHPSLFLFSHLTSPLSCLWLHVYFSLSRAHLSSPKAVERFVFTEHHAFFNMTNAKSIAGTCFYLQCICKLCSSPINLNERLRLLRLLCWCVYGFDWRVWWSSQRLDCSTAIGDNRHL